MKTKLNKSDQLIAALLVCLGIVFRVVLQDYPNVSPVAALALLAGYLLSSRMLALAVPLTVLMVIDLYFGAYAPVVMLSVYTLLALPVIVGAPLRKSHQNGKSTAFKLVTIGATGLGFSVLFFLGTNLAVWGSSSFYARDVAGLLECYTAALPFFRQTVIGDMLFVSLLFGSYASCKVWLTSKASQLVSG